MGLIVLVEGIDRVGKSTLVNHLAEKHGFGVVHFGAPRGATTSDKLSFQSGSFDTLFSIMPALRKQKIRLAFDRSHIGEFVYGPMYRNAGPLYLDWISSLEQECADDMVLLLLQTSDFDRVKKLDDGKGFDISKIEQEQDAFADAFRRSLISKKYAVDVAKLDAPSVARWAEDCIGLRGQLSTRFSTDYPE